jgi:arylsulfatase A-like enzyme
MRVPLIIKGPGVSPEQPISRAFGFATDIVPTILGFANAEPIPQAEGKSLQPILSGVADRTRDNSEGVGFELGGNATYFMAEHKLVKNRSPVGDNEWHLYNIQKDPTEQTDLKQQRPELFAEMRTRYENYARAHGVLEVPPGYDQRMQVATNQARSMLRQLVPVLMGITILIVLSLILIVRVWRSRHAY